MSGVYQLEILETVEELKELLVQQKTASNHERVQLLYLLKTGQSRTISDAASILGRNRVTLHKWLGKYVRGGIEALLEQKHSPGRPRVIPEWATLALAKRLNEPEGFNSYQEIVDWLNEKLGVASCYKTIHKLVHYRLASQPKVPRTQSIGQSESQVKAFKKTSPKT